MLPKNRYYPKFIEPHVRRRLVEGYQGEMTNWLRVHAIIAKLEPDEHALDVVASMMFAEYHRARGPRMDIITRLHGRFNNLRYEVERVALARKPR